MKNRELGVTDARTVVVCPDANESYRVLPAEHALAEEKAISVSDFMRERALAAPDRFRVVSQRQLFYRFLEDNMSAAVLRFRTRGDRAPWGS